MSRRVFYYVQHLLGVGHLKRASLIAAAMVEAGLDVGVVLGGAPVDGIDFDGCTCIFLPPARTWDQTFEVLVDERGVAVDDAWRDARCARLLAEFEAFDADALVIEHFPFGRRKFRFELLPLLEAARAGNKRPAVFSSIRDILVSKRDPKRTREMVLIARRWFDRVLVHGDPDLVSLDVSFEAAAEIADLLSYTGYVVEPFDLALSEPRLGSTPGEVVVSVGGGAVGEPLVRAAIAAKRLSRLDGCVWRIICGPNFPDLAFNALAWDPPSGVIVERWRADFRDLLANSILSISQGGYNTLMDILQSKVPAVVVPFAGGSENEQDLRARLFAERGLVTVVDSGTLSPERLAAGIDAALEERPKSTEIDLSGATTTARIIAEFCDREAGRDD